MTLLTILLQQQGQGAGWSSIIMMVALVAIFYFFMIRPQTKRQKEIRKFREALSVGDKVVTAGGIYGKIKEIKDNIIVLEIADNVRIRIDKSSIYATAADFDDYKPSLIGLPFCRRSYLKRLLKIKFFICNFISNKKLYLCFIRVIG